MPARNPVIGDEVTFVHTARETGGEHTVARVVLKPGGGNPLHYHLTYAEEFEVVDGCLTI
jgi:quercetin dioxygenase-like cupin family protein